MVMAMVMAMVTAMVMAMVMAMAVAVVMAMVMAMAVAVVMVVVMVVVVAVVMAKRSGPFLGTASFYFIRLTWCRWVASTGQLKAGMSPGRKWYGIMA